MQLEATAMPAGNGADQAGKVRLLTLADLDSRTRAARRANDLVAGIASDLGGEDRLTVAERQLVQRAAILAAMIEDTEARWLAGRAIDLEKHLAAVNTQRRVLATIGLERRSKDVTPSIEEYVARRAAEQREGAGA